MRDQVGPRVALIDIETAPILATVWQLHDTNAIWVERDTFIMSYALKWAHERKITTHCLCDYPSYATDKCNDKALVADLWKVLDTADIIIAHNGDAFDIKKIRARLIIHGFQPPSPFKTIDTLKLARRTFRFDSNRLDALGRQLGLGRKIIHTGANLWQACIAGDPKAWAKMRRYNAQDVRLLENCYQQLKAWGNHPDLRPYVPDAQQACPTCLSTNIQRRGVAIARSRRYQRYQCQSCGCWFSGSSEKEGCHAEETVVAETEAA